MSLGHTRKSRTLEDAVNYAWSKDVVLVAAAGNSGNPSPTYPAKYENCIAVAATDSNDQKAGFSSYGSWVDVAAPGEDIFSTFPYTGTFKLQEKYGRANKYDFGNGTSMSTPFVSGLAALVWATGYTSNSAVRGQIEATCDAIPGTGKYWIHGRINACNAVGGNCSYEGTQPTPTPTPMATATPTPVPGEVTVTSITPGTMNAGTSEGVTIGGTGFALGADVTLENGSGPAPTASNINATSAITITATVTAKSGGPPHNRVWDVRVTNPDGSSGVLVDGFTVTP